MWSDAFIDPLRIGPELLAAGRAGGSLHGVTLAVKDVIDVAGIATGAGNPAFLDDAAPAPRHAAAVARLLDAGADVIGKAHTDELAFSLSGTNVHYGTPRNPRAPGRVPPTIRTPRGRPPGLRDRLEDDAADRLVGVFDRRGAVDAHARIARTILCY